MSIETEFNRRYFKPDDPPSRGSGGISAAAVAAMDAYPEFESNAFMKATDEQAANPDNEPFLAHPPDGGTWISVHAPGVRTKE
ncbi:hypothetical protein A3D03_02885 [Candidatus Gottesmanbacteria bacterium RIFCSPHIGHO2_02_FULL_40_13]|uniref:Uncharacterized protein n=1 Tax=Candidatus Gottesmanbacteria bacterium RIFCSPHIGHO2_02_FULL_40_13 TaxID=1798384 RepID=A0A1F6A9G7_9BACT|nr:MAG: hypothetical protein A3D03_02885 [Candidatus Gottesmanbacteria bacterium RIFCSPHIGHO2_02_FULL_40_13]